MFVPLPGFVNVNVHDVSWYLELAWSSGNEQGTYRIDPLGQPFRTIGASGAPRYLYSNGATAWAPRTPVSGGADHAGQGDGFWASPPTRRAINRGSNRCYRAAVNAAAAAELSVADHVDEVADRLQHTHGGPSGGEMTGASVAQRGRGCAVDQSPPGFVSEGKGARLIINTQSDTYEQAIAAMQAAYGFNPAAVASHWARLMLSAPARKRG